MTVEDLLDWVERRFISGSLAVDRRTPGGATRDAARTDATVARTFVFNSGRLVGAESGNPAEQLGQMLLYRGLIDDAALREAFKVQRETGVLLGRILVMVGAVEEVALQGVLEEQAIEALYDALTWSDGTFTFERQPAKSAGLELSIDLRACIEESRRRAVDWVAIRSLIPSDDAVLVLVDRGALVRPEDADDLRALSMRLAEAVDRGLSVAQIVIELKGGRFQLLSHLALLIGRGAVAVPEMVSAEMLAELPPEPQGAHAPPPAQGSQGARGPASGSPRTAIPPAGSASDRAEPVEVGSGVPLPEEAGLGHDSDSDLVEIEIEPPSGVHAVSAPRSVLGGPSGPPAIPGRSKPADGRPVSSLARRAAADLARQAREELAAGRRDAAFPLAREALALDTDNRELQTFAAEVERALFAELSRELLTAFRIPQIKAVPHELAALELSEIERYLIGRIDGRWDLLSLIRMGPLSAAEALLTFKQLADRGIITL